MTRQLTRCVPRASPKVTGTSSPSSVQTAPARSETEPSGPKILSRSGDTGSLKLSTRCVGACVSTLPSDGLLPIKAACAKAGGLASRVAMSTQRRAMNRMMSRAGAFVGTLRRDLTSQAASRREPDTRRFPGPCLRLEFRSSARRPSRTPERSGSRGRNRPSGAR